jgi:hypothetical protein
MKQKATSKPNPEMLARVLALQDRASIAAMRAARAQMLAARAIADLVQGTRRNVQ